MAGEVGKFVRGLARGARKGLIDGWSIGLATSAVETLEYWGGGRHGWPSQLRVKSRALTEAQAGATRNACECGS
jgi:hypothetical protein